MRNLIDDLEALPDQELPGTAVKVQTLNGVKVKELLSNCAPAQKHHFYEEHKVRIPWFTTKIASR